MSDKKETMLIHANVEVTPESLRAVVENAKAMAGKDQRGGYRVDTADLVGQMISKFLLENDFESFVKDRSNYE